MSKYRLVVDATMQSSGCYPLTKEIPNALIYLFNRTLLEHLIYNRCEVGVDIIIVVNSEHIALFNELSLPKGCEFTTDVGYLEYTNYKADSYYPRDVNSSKFDILHSWDLISCVEAHSAEAFDSIVSEGATIEQGVTLKGKVAIGRGTILKSGTYIEGDVIIGEDCIIGPNCYIRGSSSIGDRCRIGNSVELKSVIVGRDVNICHLSYLGDSVVGSDVNIGAGFISSNLRNDHQSIITKFMGVKIHTKRCKLGVVIGSGAKIGMRTSVYPGRRIWNNISIPPCSVIDRDILPPC